MSTPQEAEQHLVVFVAAGDGSDAACDTVARKLSEKFGAPYDKMLNSVRQSPRVFKRNLSREQAESCAALLRSLGAVAEVQGGTPAPEAPDAPAPESAAPVAAPEPEATKPPPPETEERTCPFCGRALLEDGSCVICRPHEVAPAAAPIPVSDPDPAPAPAPEPKITAEPPPPAAEPALDVQTEFTPEDLPPAGQVLDPNIGFEDPGIPDQPGVDPAPRASTFDLEELGMPAVEPGCAGCGSMLSGDGQCPVCDAPPAAVTEAPPPPETVSAAIENDLSAMLPPEELGVCPNCCGPMEQDGTCLICPPSEQAPATPEAQPDIAPAAIDPLEQPAFDEPGVAAGPLEEDEGSPFEPLAPLSAEPEADGSTVCNGCNGPLGPDGICLICGMDTAGGDPAAAEEPTAPPEAEEMSFTGNEPPPALSETTVEGSGPAMIKLPSTEATNETDTPIAAEPKADTAPSTGKKQKVRPNNGGLPRALTIPLLITLLLTVGGVSLAVSGSFVFAAGVYFLALLAGLVSAFNLTRHLEQAVDSFPRLPKPVIFAFLVFLFFAGSGWIATYVIKSSAELLLAKAGEELQAEAERLAAGGAAAGGSDTGATEAGAGEGQILLEEDMLDRAIEAERKGEENPHAALETWRAYLEGFPDATRAPEAKRKVSHWQAVVKRQNAFAEAIARDRKGNTDPEARIRGWRSVIATYGNNDDIREHAEARIAFWDSLLHESSTPRFPYWASIQLNDGRRFSGKVIFEDDQRLKMELPNRLKMSFGKGEYELIESDHINGKQVEAEDMRLVSGVTTDKPAWGREDGITILGEGRAGVETTVSFQLTGFYHFEVMARADRDHGGFPSVILSLNGAQQERIRFDSEDWKLYRVAFPFRIPAGEQRLEIVFPPQYQTMNDKRLVAIDYFTTAMVE